MKAIDRLIPCVIIFLGVVGCAASPPATVGERMTSQGEDTRILGKQWSEGNTKVGAGEKLKKEGEQQVQSGQEKIRKGDQMIEDGKRMMEESEQTFQGRFPGKSMN